jgi:N-acetylglutamate synthase-like GNAT family acetyltransferase
MADIKTLIEQAYSAFNKRDIDGALVLMAEDVSWPKASEGGRVVGKEEVRAYWTRQWGEFDPHVEPLAITEGDGGKVRVRVDQLVKSLQGDVLSESDVLHVFTMHGGLIAAMDLGAEANPTSGPSAAFAHDPPVIEIRSLAPDDDATAFRTLNEEWITRDFTLEAKDRETLNDPVDSILLKGGHIFIAYAGDEAVGCVALIPMRDGVYELSKMAVSPHLRGRGIGRRLLQHALVQAKCLGAKSLFLGSNTRLKDAVHLYESVGFRHVKPEALPPMPYSRADVFMEMPLG